MIMVVPLTMGLSCCVCQTPGRSGLGCYCALTRHEHRTALGDVRSVTCARPGSGRRRLSCLRRTVVADSDGCMGAGHTISAFGGTGGSKPVFNQGVPKRHACAIPPSAFATHL